MKIHGVVSIAAMLLPHLSWGMSAGQLRTGYLAGDRIENGTTKAAANDALLGGQAMGYTQGVIAALNGGTFCLPPDATPNQAFAIVRKFLDENPAVWNEPAVGVIVFALKRPFPCKGGDSK